MSEETFFWIASVGIPALIAFSVSITVQLSLAQRDRSDIKSGVSKLIEMHENPEHYGFGTHETNKYIQDNARATNALVHYIRWFVEQQTGQTPPPPIE